MVLYQVILKDGIWKLNFIHSKRVLPKTNYLKWQLDTYYFDKELIKCELLIPYNANKIINKTLPYWLGNKSKNLPTFINHSNIDSKQLQWCLNVWHTIVKLLEDLQDGLCVIQVFSWIMKLTRQCYFCLNLGIWNKLTILMKYTMGS